MHSLCIIFILVCVTWFVQVSIAGNIPQVEKARHSIRELSPIFLWIELVLNPGMNIADHNTAVEDIMTTYNVNVQIKPVSFCQVLWVWLRVGLLFLNTCNYLAILLIVYICRDSFPVRIDSWVTTFPYTNSKLYTW